MDRSSRKPPFSSSCPWKKGKEQRPAANRTASVHLHQALPTGSPSSKDQYVSANVFHRCCPLSTAKSTVLVSLTVWSPHPSISAVLGVTAHNPAYRIITQVYMSPKLSWPIVTWLVFRLHLQLSSAIPVWTFPIVFRLLLPLLLFLGLHLGSMSSN